MPAPWKSSTTVHAPASRASRHTSFACRTGARARHGGPPGEDVLEPHRVGGPFGGPSVHVLVHVPAGPTGDGSQRRADQVRLPSHNRKLVAVGLERVGHRSCSSRYSMYM